MIYLMFLMLQKYFNIIIQIKNRCDSEYYNNNKEKINKIPPKLEGNIIFVDSNNGNNKNDGSISFPLHDISYAIKKCRSLDGYCTISLREGTYYLKDTLKLYECDNNMSIIGYNNEKVIISGGKEIKPEWELFDNSIIIYKDTTVMNDLTIKPNQNSTGIIYKGIVNDYNECNKICENNNDCLSFTYYYYYYNLVILIIL